MRGPETDRFGLASLVEEVIIACAVRHVKKRKLQGQFVHLIVDPVDRAALSVARAYYHAAGMWGSPRAFFWDR